MCLNPPINSNLDLSICSRADDSGQWSMGGDDNSDSPPLGACQLSSRAHF